ncbi:hypothetical protein GMB86_11415 [Terrilactibacillus sp. BCM23-1]|uniref:YpoC-like domain-containing protein n=1 Tax=Terrilactibacillus tamarindi TaxID=2599694 RepID=A0A6N8CR23_9BACI|nr:hypothetical protein [Terrilactibacillus tamarindi]MTT32614.1 hypothetical protein [Terrilactibacillus tamarindi]
MKNDTVKIRIPRSFCYPPFYHEGDMLPLDIKTQDSFPFFYDVLYLSHDDQITTWPWQDIGSVEALFDHWKMISPQLKDAFHNRRGKHVQAIIILALANYIDLLFWINGKPVPTLDQSLYRDMVRLALIPVNAPDRVRYICHKPVHHASFIQLNALYDELRKKYVARKIRKM